MHGAVSQDLCQSAATAVAMAGTSPASSSSTPKAAGIGSLRDVRRQECYSNQFYKTKLCTYWQRRKCMRGASCRFAHGVEELNRPPDLNRTALCRRKLKSGACDDPNCQYAHDASSLRATDMFYKTTMCYFHQYGVCRFGQSCRHAHSPSELRVTLTQGQQAPGAASISRQIQLPQETPDINIPVLPTDFKPLDGSAENRPPSEELQISEVGERCPSLPSIPGDVVFPMEEEEEVEFAPDGAWARSFSAPADAAVGTLGPAVASAPVSSYRGKMPIARRQAARLPLPLSRLPTSEDGGSRLLVNMGLLMAPVDHMQQGADTTSVLQQMLENAMPDHYEE